MRLPHLAVFLAVSLAPWPSLRGDEEVDFFERKIRPVLVERCYGCHSADANEDKGGLQLDTRDSMMRGGESGPAVVPHRASESLLLSAIRYETLEMPPDGKLSEETLRDFERWIERGAIDPRVEVEKPREKIRSEIDYGEGRKFWAFQPPRLAAAPTVTDSGWSNQRIDAFILQPLEEKGLKPNPPAEPHQLVRRLSYDLVGLPPTPEMAAYFADEPSPSRYAKLVDQLLESPAFGERWARLWLDIARYGEDQAHIVGKNRELCYPNAYLYRDWVVRAFNQDMPYNTFLKHQIAADLLDESEEAELVALGFIGLGPKYYRRNSPEVMADEWEDRIDVVSRGVLGLTIACARCHDHKFDPIGTEDYYGLAGIFASTEMFNRPLNTDVKLDKNGQAESETEAMHIVREAEAKDIAVMIRGDVNRLGPTVPRRFVKVLSPDEPQPYRSGSGRRELAESLTDPRNPLTARVMVNRVWGEVMGSHLVGTPSNFGAKGEPPSHPELLDDLAVRWMENGWSLKWLLRELVVSNTYQQSSAYREDGEQVDPENRYFWRMNRKRLPIEAWRDGILAVSGQLESAVGGTSIDPSDPSQSRRTLYSEISRLSVNRMLSTFDFPDPNAHSDRRAETITPLQKLFVMNSPFMIHQAEQLATRVEKIAKDPASRITWTYRLLFQREPTATEMEVSLKYLEDDDSRWDEWSQVLLATNEFAIID